MMTVFCNKIAIFFREMKSRIYLVDKMQADWCDCSVATADRALEIADSLV